MTEKSKEGNEPSIEEILASIRGIISKDNNNSQKPKDAPDHQSDNNNLKGKYDNKTASVFSDDEVTNETKSPKKLVKEEIDSMMVNDLAKELMRPIIKEWLDRNLLTIVERVVRHEVERLARLSEKKE